MQKSRTFVCILNTINSNLSKKAETAKLPYGFRDIEVSLWTESSATLDNADFGLSVYSNIGNIHTDINTWYVFTFYEGGTSNKTWGIQVAIGRGNGKSPLLIRVKWSGTWGNWIEK